MARRNSTAQAHAAQSGSGRRTKRQNARGKSVDVVRPIGRPTALTDRVEETILGHLLSGCPTNVACHLAGISEGTFHRWMQRGEDARETLDATGSLPETEERFRDFRESVLDARAQCEARLNGVIMKSVNGGFVTSERPITDINGVVQLGPDGEVLYERSTTPPDGRLAMQWLQRRRATNWSQQAANVNAKVEVSGPGGAPVQVEHTVQQVTDLTARLMQVRQEFETDEAVLAAAERGEEPGPDGSYDISSMGDE